MYSTRHLVSITNDPTMSRATSTLPDLPDVENMRHALDEIALYAALAHAAATANIARGDTSNYVPAWYRPTPQDCLTNWITQTRHLLRELPDDATPADIPAVAVTSMHEVASWSIHVARAAGFDTAAVPHIDTLIPANT